MSSEPADWKGRMRKSMGVISASLLIAAIIAKYSTKDGDGTKGHFGLPTGTFGVWSIFMILLCIAIILGELEKGLKYIGWFPLLISRTGRGGLLLFIFFETICRQKVVIALSIIAMVIALVMIALGWKDEQVTVKFEAEEVAGTNVEMYVVKNLNNQPQSNRPGTSFSPFTGKNQPVAS